MNDIDIFVLFVDSGAGGADSLVGGLMIDLKTEEKRGLPPSLAHCPVYVLGGRLCCDVCTTLQSSTGW